MDPSRAPEPAPAAAQPGRSPGRSPTMLWNGDFIRWLTGLALAAVGDAVVYVAIPFLVLAMGGGADAVAWTLVAATAPRFFGPVLGSWADRWPLRVPVAVASALRSSALVALAIAAMAGPVPFLWLYATAFLNGAMALFVFTSGEVTLPHLVPRASLQHANSLLQGALMGLPLVGFAAGGAIVAAVGAATTVLGAALAFVPLAVLALGIRFPTPEPDARGTAIGRDLLLGARFLAAHGALLVLGVASFFMNAALNVLNVVVPVAMERRGFGAAGYGSFEAAISAGVIGGIALSALVANRLALRWQIALGTAGTVLGLGTLALGFGRADAPLLLLAGSAAPLGLGLGLSEVAAVTLFQLAVPDGIRGKVIGTLFTLNAAGLAAGAALAGRLEPLVSPSVLFAGAGAAAVLLLVVWLFVAARGPLVAEAPSDADPAPAQAPSGAAPAAR